jgi:alkanesulfonate monooxygenase SsuD/methylene tetrahydromethanopterin reductase-like flavin-dependent oxidoreductase (luciferase family)
MIKPWLFDIFMYTGDPAPEAFDPALCQRTYDQYLARWAAAEQRGLEGVFFSEHHFRAFNLSPSPNLLIAAVAQRTSTLRLGVMCNVVHLHDPRRLAEECGMLDYLTGGRLEIGAGGGGNPRETVQAGLDPAQIPGRYASGLAVLEAAMTAPYLTRHDEFARFDRVPVRPRPRQQPAPPIWMTSLSAASAERAARRGHKLALAWLPAEYLRKLAGAYRAAAAGPDAGDPDRIGLRRRVFLAPSQAEADDIVQAAPDSFLDGEEIADPAVRAVLTNPEDIIVGTPAVAAEILIAQARDLQIGNLLLWTDFRAFTPGHLDRCHELIGRHLVPALRKAAL